MSSRSSMLVGDFWRCVIVILNDKVKLVVPLSAVTQSQSVEYSPYSRLQHPLRWFPEPTFGGLAQVQYLKQPKPPDCFMNLEPRSSELLCCWLFEL